MHTTIESENINAWLKNQVKIPLTDKPLFRLVWSNDLYEDRLSLFPIYDENGLLLSHIEQVRNVRKYNYINHRWIIEQWLPPEIAFSPELPDSANGDWMCIYVFESSNGQMLPLRLDVVQRVVQHACRSVSSYGARLSAQMKILENKEKLADQTVEDCLNDESYLVSQMHSGSAVLNVFDNKKK